MSNYLKKIYGCVIMVVTMFIVSVTSFAGETMAFDERSIPVIGTVKEYVKSDNEVRTTGIVRGKLISTVEVGLINLGRGEAEISADIYCHEAAATIRMVLFLEKWDETNESWEQEERFEYGWKAEDAPDGKLTSAMTSFNVYGLDRGYKYRVRGLFGAYSLDSDLQEAWQAWTTDVYFD